MKEITPRQQSIYDFIVAYQSANGYPPTIAEIMAEFDIKSTNGVRCQLFALEKKEYIKRVPKASRGIVPLKIEGEGNSEVVGVSSKVWGDVNRFFENFYNYGFEDLEWRVEEMKANLREV